MANENVVGVWVLLMHSLTQIALFEDLLTIGGKVDDWKSVV